MSAYADFLKSVAFDDESSRWVLHFLHSASTASSERSTQLHVFDSHGMKLEKISIAANEVAKIPAGVQTRIVWLVYPHLQELHRPTLDQVANTLKIPPLILWRHLDVEPRQMPPTMTFGIRPVHDDFPILDLSCSSKETFNVTCVLLRHLGDSGTLVCMC